MEREQLRSLGEAGPETLTRVRAATPPAANPAPPARAKLPAPAIGWTLAAFVVLGAGLRLWGLGSSSLSFDESFTAMSGRLPVGSLFAFLRSSDSHPPLDYLLQLPFARAAASPFLFRLPAAACSIAALALFARWMRDRGRVGVVATGAMAICAFQIAHAREARMYGPMQLIGVGTAMVAYAWLRAPRYRHAIAIGVLTFVGLMTHVSMVLAAVGLLAVAGRRRDADAWRWRAAIATGASLWALLWGASFLVQSHGGHSSWIPHTSPGRFVATISALVTTQPGARVPVFAAIVAGTLICRRRDRTIGRVLLCCFAVPVLLGGLLGLRAPVLLDRTFTVAAWGPVLALGYLADFLTRRARLVGAVAIAVVAISMFSSIPRVFGPTGPTAALTALERVARPGDIIAIQPPSKGVELEWTFAARGIRGPARQIHVPGLDNAVVLALVGHAPTGRIWLLQMSHQAIHLPHPELCARTWNHGPNRMLCVVQTSATGFTHTSPPSIAALHDEFPG